MRNDNTPAAESGIRIEVVMLDGDVLCALDVAPVAELRSWVELVQDGEGGLNTPQGLVFLANGDLLVSSQGSDAILKYVMNGNGDGDFVDLPPVKRRSSGDIF